MTTLQIELPDEQAMALKARATAQGLTLEEWFQRLAEQQSPEPRYRLQECRSCQR
jgi:hypothetical protein